MIFITIPIIIFLLTYRIKIAEPDSYFKDNMSIEKTTSINGLFVALVFFSHFKGYIANLNSYDKAFYSLPIIFTQLIVVTFLFYSGYGMMESIKSKGNAYIRTIPQKRFPKLFIDFAIAIVMYIIVNLILGRHMDLKNVLLAFTGWTSILNSNWYIFAIFSFYIIMYLSFTLTRKKPYIVGVFLTMILSVVFVYQLSNVKESWYYDTFMVLSFGMLFSLVKDKIYNFLKKDKPWNYIVTLFITLLSFVVLFKYCKNNAYVFNIISIIFAFLIYLITLKVSFNNKILNWIGKHTFWIYVLQRIPMIIFRHVGLAKFNTYLYFAVCVAVTLLLSVIFKFISTKIEHLIWRKPKQVEKQA